MTILLLLLKMINLNLLKNIIEKNKDYTINNVIIIDYIF
jgi:hypothetical protein